MTVVAVMMMEIDDTDYYSDGDGDLAHGDDGNYDTVDFDNGGDGVVINLAHGDGLLRFSRLAHLAGPQAVRFSMIHLMLKIIL